MLTLHSLTVWAGKDAGFLFCKMVLVIAKKLPCNNMPCALDSEIGVTLHHAPCLVHSGFYFCPYTFSAVSATLPSFQSLFNRDALNDQVCCTEWWFSSGHFHRPCWGFTLCPHPSPLSFPSLSSCSLSSTLVTQLPLKYIFKPRFLIRVGALWYLSSWIWLFSLNVCKTRT